MLTRSLPLVSEEVYGKFSACVHCGFCLPACPTYLVTGDESDSPRGRILLMKAAVDGRVEVGKKAGENVFNHLDRCLLCRACEVACPSGVEYHVLMEAVRPVVTEKVLGRGRKMRSRSLQLMVDHVFPYANRARAGMLAGRMAMKMGLGKLVPETMRDGLEGDFSLRNIDCRMKAQGERRGSVVLLRGCVGSVVSGTTNNAAARVLAANGFDVEILEEESCCGAMAAHANNPQGAKESAMRMVDLLSDRKEDFFISPIGGCGAQLKSLDTILAGLGYYEAKAKKVVSKMRDVTELLVEVGVREMTQRVERVVTFHDPCHMLNVQKLSNAPRHLLSLIPGLQVVPLPETDVCCGAAGTYSMNQPEMSERIGRRKIANILQTGASEVITANVGCAMQLEKELKHAGHIDIKVRHVVEVMAEGYE
ncbi:MAG: heterodisulfide reductase-related iron-sulfur binding cluster [Phycisphaerales bacterium]|nr:heterodisulfide reductase-related iron-sulfur binding cluster [Phycisphaerales bacterium]